MQSFARFLFRFFLFGLLWFLIYSVPTPSNDSLFASLHELINTDHIHKERKKDIDPEQVTKALSDAFKK